MPFNFFLGGGRPKTGKTMLFAGGFFILFGILVASHPEILVYLISSLFLLIGFIFFRIGLGQYQMGKKMKQGGFMDTNHFNPWGK